MQGRNNHFFHSIVFGVLLISACSERKAPESIAEKKNHKMFEILSPKESGINFANKLPESTRMNGLFYEYYYNGSGVATGDFDNDGLVDIYFVSTLDKNKLYLNTGDLNFKDSGPQTSVGGKALFQTGVTTVDINNDGWLDIYVCASGKFEDPNKRKNELYVNQGLNENNEVFFEEKAADYGLDLPNFSTQAAFFDYDRDGDLDMFLINHDVNVYQNELLEVYANSTSNLSGDALFKNENGFFVDVTTDAGIVNNRLSFGLGLATGDVNNDGWPDVYVSHDFSGRDHLYLNAKDGTFKETTLASLNHISNFSMGNDMADFNNDGWLDVVTLDMMSEDNYGIKTSMSSMNPEQFYKVVGADQHYQYMFNALQMNNGVTDTNQPPQFSDIAQMAGISSTDWSWAPLMFDMDLDGLKDMFVSNGIKRDFRNNDFVNFHKELRAQLSQQKTLDERAYVATVMARIPTRNKPNYFYRNKGDLTFENKNEVWADGNPTSSNGAAIADFDNDGDMDLVVNNTDSLSYIQKNLAREFEQGNYLKVAFKGSSKNSLGIGAKVMVTTPNENQMHEHYVTRGFQSAVAPGLHFGLDNEKTVEKLKVIWPDGKVQLLKKIKTNQTLTMDYRDAVAVTAKTDEGDENKRWFKTMDVGTAIAYKHMENEFDDFERESLLPHRMSQFGPALATADVNGDGLDDIYVGGSAGNKGHLFLQNSDGSFVSVQEKLFKAEKKYEDVGATFFDADNDGDLDLYVVSGGNEAEAQSNKYEDRFYENKNGTFGRTTGVLPKLYESGSCVRPHDYDGDGDMDLFVGGRQVPGKYPISPNSYLLQNSYSETADLSFTDVTPQVAPAMEKMGMVTDAVWVDIDNDGLTDLAVTGEWMPITILKNTGTLFEDKTQEYGLSEDTGWWFSVAAADFDNDGDMDLMGGNLGLNYKYKASKEEPFEIYATDFDDSGDLDIVLGYYNGGDLFPLRGRECSSNQMPFIKEKFPSYDAFGKATLIDVYGGEKLEGATHYAAKNFASSYFENKEGKRFEVVKLPMEVQLSSVNVILPQDFDQDGNMDVVVAGNLYGSEVETPRNDAGFGLFLKGDGIGGFVPIPAHQSGISISGEVRQTAALRVSGQKMYVMAINQGPLVAIKKM